MNELPEGVTEEYPFDTSTLEKGSRVTAEQIERATGCSPESKNFGLAMLRIKGYVTWRLAQRGLDVVVRAVKNDLVILTDSDAAPYTDAKFQNRIAQAAHALQEQLSVSRHALTDGERLRHDRACAVNGATLAGARKARKAELALPTRRVRQTPELARGNNED